MAGDGSVAAKAAGIVLASLASSGAPPSGTAAYTSSSMFRKYRPSPSAIPVIASSGAGASSMKRHMRVAAEMANLPTLAVNYPSSILVRQDESSIDYLRALMTGPTDTPYAGGCFFFDIYLPPSYPQVNPSVIFLTTGGGSARFNPNLYADGKVCLSLLGTWSGPGWDPAISTLAQVLISIQAQIMNEAPYYNECV